MTRRNPGLLASIVSVPFILCVLILATGAIGQTALVQWLDIVTRKAALPLRKPLDLMDQDRLTPYRLVHANRMTAAMEDTLGTDQYIDWVLIDTSAKRPKDPRRYVHLSVTYYTGKPSLVPHTPDVCRVASGYKQHQPHEGRVIDVPALGADESRIPVRVCTFVKTAISGGDTPTVVYTFHANGEFQANRMKVRNVLTRLRDKHAYFSKVEVSFGGRKSQPRNLGREDSVVATAKFLNTVLPVLIEDHWPDWELAENTNPDERG